MVNKKMSEQLNIVKWLGIFGIFSFHFSDAVQRYTDIEILKNVEKFLHIGSQGIHIFFILSAFFLYIKYIYHNTKFNLFDRIKKLYPQYLVSVIFVILLYGLSGIYFLYDEIIVNIIPLIRNFSFEYIRSINGNWWFLHTLIEFYIVFFIYIKFYRKKLSMSNRKLIISTLFLYLIYVLFISLVLKIDSQVLNPYSSFFLNYIYDFTFGILLARYYIDNKFDNVHLWSIFLLGIFFEFIGYMITVEFISIGYHLNDIFFALGIFFIFFVISGLLIKVKNITKILDFFINRVYLIYFIYLIHHPIIILLLKNIKMINNFQLFLVYIFSCFIIFSLAVLLNKILIFITNIIKSKNVF